MIDKSSLYKLRMIALLLIFGGIYMSFDWNKRGVLWENNNFLMAVALSLIGLGLCIMTFLFIRIIRWKSKDDYTMLTSEQWWKPGVLFICLGWILGIIWGFGAAENTFQRIVTIGFGIGIPVIAYFLYKSGENEVKKHLVK